MIENKFKKAIYAADLDFSVECYKEWDEDTMDCSNTDVAVTFSSLAYQYNELQQADGIDKDGKVVENDYVEVEVAEELVKLYQFCKENKVDMVIL